MVNDTDPLDRQYEYYMAEISSTTSTEERDLDEEETDDDFESSRCCVMRYSPKTGTVGRCTGVGTRKLSSMKVR